MTIARFGWIAGFLCIAGSYANAADMGRPTGDCDQFHQYPNQPGPGPVYEGLSPLPEPGPGLRPVLQWACFFKIRSRIVSISAWVLDAKGNPGPYPQYNVTFNYDYYPDQTEIKLSFQRLPARAPKKKLPKENWMLKYIITFEKESIQPVADAGAGAISCYNRICTYINKKGETFYVSMNDNTVIPRGPLPGPKGSTSVSCGILGNPEERCAAVDNAGQIWRIGLRPMNGPTNVWSPAQTPGAGQKGPFIIGCDNTRYCFVVNAAGQSWKGPFEANDAFVGGPQLPQ